MKNDIDPKYKADIVVVDDMQDNLRLLSKLLMDHGYYVRPVSDGKKALLAIHEQVPDLILLDIMMPGMDGYEICRKLKADERTKHTPIIFISALNDIKNKVKAFSEGCVDYLPKPFQEEEVLARVNTHVTLLFIQRCMEKKNIELQKALDEVRQLRGFLPLCHLL